MVVKKPQKKSWAWPGAVGPGGGTSHLSLGLGSLNLWGMSASGGWSSLGARHLQLCGGGWCVGPGDLRVSG